MLILTEKLNDRIDIDDGRITVVVVGIQNGRVQLGFEADLDIVILRHGAKKREPKERGNADHRTDH
jgi:carbon storage regulator CsrA